jgi:NADH:quinone reductase (non-electrogenic)
MRGVTLTGRGDRVPKVVVVGGGMGGIAAARKLARAPVDVTLVDARNYYLFQPLIYQVAGGMSNVEDISHSIRGLLRGWRNVGFRLANAVSVDLEEHELVLEGGEERLPFDYLILSTGLCSDVERVPGAAAYAFPLKTLADALRLRNHLLRRLETVAAHPELTAAGALDLVIVGGGTTGVEVAAAFTEIYDRALRDEFPELDFSQAKITVLEAGDALLSAFHLKLQHSALRMLRARGAEVRFRSQVAEVGPASVILSDGSELAAGTVVWATGVRATPLADALGVAQASDGRVLVGSNLSLPGHSEVFAIGDMAALPRRAGGLHPALAQFAIQSGRHAAREILRDIAGEQPRPFRYWDKGMTSIVGRNAAVVQSGRLRLSGRLAYFFWAFLHGFYVPGLRNRLSVTLTWIWSYATRRRAGLLLIDEPSPPAEEPEPARTIPLNIEERVRRLTAAIEEPQMPVAASDARRTRRWEPRDGSDEERS